MHLSGLHALWKVEILAEGEEEESKGEGSSANNA